MCNLILPNMCVPVTCLWSLILIWMCKYISTCTWLLTSAPPLWHLHLCQIVAHKHVHPSVALYECLSHYSSGPKPWLECVHAPVHYSTIHYQYSTCMSTWLPTTDPAISIVVFKYVCNCVAPCMCHSHPFLSIANWYLKLEVRPPIRGIHLWSEFSLPGGIFSSFSSGVVTIFDYSRIKPTAIFKSVHVPYR